MKALSAAIVLSLCAALCVPPPASAADDEKNSFLGLLVNALGQSQNPNQSQSQNQYPYQNQYPAYGNANYPQGDPAQMEQERQRLYDSYAALRQKEASLWRDRAQMRDDDARLAQLRASGQDTSELEERIAHQRQAYNDDLAAYQSVENNVLANEQRFAQAGGRVPGYDNRYVNGGNGGGYHRRSSPYIQRSSGWGRESADDPVWEHRERLWRDKQQMDDLNRRLEEARAAGQDTSAIEQEIAHQQQAYEDDRAAYQRAEDERSGGTRRKSGYFRF